MDFNVEAKCAEEATLRRADSAKPNPKGAQASARRRGSGGGSHKEHKEHKDDFGAGVSPQAPNTN